MLAAAFLVWSGTAPAGETMVLDGLAAAVNDRMITLGDVLMYAAPAERDARLRLDGAAFEQRLDEIYRRALDSLVARALLLEEAKRRDLKVPDRAIDDYINNIVHDRFGNNRTAFLQMLAEEKLTLPEYRDQTRDSLIAMLLRRQEVSSRIAVPPHDLQRIYQERIDQYRTPEQVRLRVLTVGVKSAAGDTPDAQRARAEAARQRIAAGAPFDAVAKEISDGPRAADGGDWGWMPTTDLRGELREAVARLAPGAMTPIIPADGVNFLVKLEERKAPSVRPFEEVRGDLEKELRQTEDDRRYGEWISLLKSRHYVRIFMPNRPR